jgi:hypothetical protein
VGSRFRSPGFATLCLGAWIIACSGSTPSPESAQSELRGAPPPRVFAVLLNGGGSAKKNYQSHWLHVHELAELLVSGGVPEAQITVFASDGQDPTPDLAVRGREPEEHHWLIEDLPLARRLRNSTHYKDSEFGKYRVHAARKAALEEWFGDSPQLLASGDTLLIYVTDHGNRNDKDLSDNTIVLWGEELSVREFGDLLGHLPDGVRVVTLMSQCFSGSFANVIYDSETGKEPDGSVCGYFASTAELPAHGCYAENRGRHNVGYSFRFFEAMRSTPMLPEAHARVLVTDQTPDIPNRTSDHYLEQLIERGAAEQGIKADELIEKLLEIAWSSGEGLEPEAELLKQVNQAFGSLEVRSIRELERERRTVADLQRRLSVYARRWRIALTDLKRANFDRFLAQNPDWNVRVQEDVLKTLDLGQRQQLRHELLEGLAEFAQADLTMWIRLETMRAWAKRVEEARYRMQVRGATIQRSRSILTRIAGRVYLETLAAPEEWLAFEQLDTCEDFALAEPDAPLSSRLVEPTPFPPLSDDFRLAHAAAPGWLGIQFQMPQGSRVGYGPGAVKVTKVLEGGPAERAGINAGDIILGPPGDHFVWRNEIREWIMLSPVHESRELEISRDGTLIVVSIRTDPYPLRLPK